MKRKKKKIDDRCISLYTSSTLTPFIGPPISFTSFFSHDEITREKALATVVQGQNAENLLDFGEDDEAASNGAVQAPSGIGMMDDMIQPNGSSKSNSSQQQGAGSQLNDLLGL